MSELTPAQRSIRARIGAYAQKAKYNPRDLTENARAAATTTLNRELCERYGIDLSSPDGERRLQAARSAHFSTLALRRSRNRTKAERD